MTFEATFSKNYLIPFISVLFFLTSCASQRAPSGGPPDTTPPQILNVIPENNSTSVPLNQQVEIAFSESMDKKTLERAIFITPNPGDRVEFDWDGDKLQITFLDSLRTNRTYVITLGTDLKDSHGNALETSFTLAFSTGEKISNGRIDGTVYSDEKTQGILIWAYILENGRQPNPIQAAGDYVTQTDAQGGYQLSHLSEGKYRVFAILDKDNNRFFEPGFDGLGVPHRDITLAGNDLSASDMNFRPVIQDTLGPALVSVAPQDRSHLSLQFDENLLKTGVDDTKNYRIQSTKNEGDSLGVKLAYLNIPNRQQIILVTEPQVSQSEYRIEVTNVRDESGNPIDPEFSKSEFIGSALADTARPNIVKHSPEDSARAVPLDTAIEFHFSEPLDRESFEHHVRFKDSMKQEVDGTFAWETSAFVTFQPTRLLNGLSDYFVRVASDSVVDLFGNSLADSTFQFVFSTVSEDTLSSISGTLTDEDSTARGIIYLKAVETTQENISYELQLDKPGHYEFKNILPGTYRIEVVRDRDDNGRYSYGQAVPFEPSERYLIYSQNIKVRARWPNEGNDIILPK
ncbi:Ig-like domain-containing protein [candidate division KSB1 bacterium]|nr:Ig-like domain-containing protein [candidate division KSB1 bacterium]NIR72691.1 Ig-like domain-containing protein [candidate division KSB1 bacterium]NIS26776.1 Ig-like domain-containing protein [candidate division KSB1 bacterium]NIT73570.1 Ig-like domain-containing protein [candidate division KSB1 bacterium]NIU27446.1 Ig-like domain-containing protein [candidate division KSB1 bacterium]